MALVVFTGGARCGKSACAQELALKRSETSGQGVTVAVFGNPEGDSQFADQIEENRAQRPSSFKTLEAYYDPNWFDKVPEDDILLIDSLGTVLSSQFEILDTSFEELSDSVGGSDNSRISRAFNGYIARIIGRKGDTIVVTNQVGDGIVPGFDSARLFRNLIGYANDDLVAASDAAYYVVCGRLIDLKELPTVLDWPED